MIKLRLQRRGRKKRPFYHIVVADSRSPRDGRIIERVGRFDNVSEKKELTFDEDRIIHWLKIGARPSETVRNLLKSEGILYKMHLIRWGKTDEEIEAALEEWKSQRETTEPESEKASRKERERELLKAEEKEYKKQLEQKAAEAAAALEKEKEEKEKKAAEEAKAAETEKEAETKVEAEEAVAEATEEKAAEAEAEEKPEEKTPEVAETKGEETGQAEKPVKVKKELPTEAEVKPKEEAEAQKESKATEEAKEEKTESEAKKTEAVKEETASSADMNANEAIEHIKNTPLDQLEGFISEDEERVTVLRAWESKQSEKE